MVQVIVTFTMELVLARSIVLVTTVNYSFAPLSHPCVRRVQQKAVSDAKLVTT